MPSVTPKSTQLSDDPSCLNTGPMVHAMSTTRMIRMTSAIQRTTFGLRLKDADSSSRNGSANWPSSSVTLIGYHGPCSRWREHRLSCGKLADHMISKCEKEKEAH